MYKYKNRYLCADGDIDNVTTYIRGLRLDEKSIVCCESVSVYNKIVLFKAIINAGHVVMTDTNNNISSCILQCDHDLTNISVIYKQVDKRTLATDTICILKSSGTSGKTKYVQLSERNLLTNVRQVHSTGLYGPGEVFISFFDMKHIYGIFYFIYFSEYYQYTALLYDTMEEYFAGLTVESPTIIHAIPAMLKM